MKIRSRHDDRDEVHLETDIMRKLFRKINEITRMKENRLSDYVPKQYTQNDSEKLLLICCNNFKCSLMNLNYFKKNETDE